MINEEKNKTDADFEDELQTELALACEDVPKELYSSVMARIEKEKKKKRTAFMRTFAGACAAAFVFAVSALFVFPRLAENSVTDNFAPDAAVYHGAKSLEENDGIINEDAARAPAEPAIGDVMLCRTVADAMPEVNGELKPLAEYQSGRILVVKEGGRYFASDIDSGDDVHLSVLVADILRAEKYLSSKYNEEIELEDNNDFCFVPSGIQIQGKYVFPWDMIPEEAFVKYAFDRTPEIIKYLDHSDYDITKIRQTQN